ITAVARLPDGPLPMRHLLLVPCLLLLTGVSWSEEPEPAKWTELVGENAAADAWKSKLQGWTKADAVALDEKNEKRLVVTKPGKPIMVNGKTGREPDLITKEVYGDHEVELEFLIAKKSNSGVKFHGLYEIQITDTHGKKDADLTGDDCGGIYPKATLTPSY